MLANVRALINDPAVKVPWGKILGCIHYSGVSPFLWICRTPHSTPGIVSEVMQISQTRFRSLDPLVAISQFVGGGWSADEYDETDGRKFRADSIN